MGKPAGSPGLRTESEAMAYPSEMSLPASKRRRHGTALALSGGGFRAALFHLGALRRLNELGILSQIDTVTSVSGGSIVAAHLATRVTAWPERGQLIPDWERVIAEPLRIVAAHNLRALPLVKRLLPWNWFRSSVAVEELAKAYERRLTPLSLAALPTHPRFILCATDTTFGVNWVFDSAPPGGAGARMGDYQAGYGPFPLWPLARAVAASSCCPPFFDPLPLALGSQTIKRGAYTKPDRDTLVAGIRLSDGGVYDNMGLEPVWKDHRRLLVSDGGAVFADEDDRGLLWRAQRYAGIVDRQSRALRKRWLIAGFVREGDDLAGGYWGIRSGVAHDDAAVPMYSRELVEDVIARVRTDIDAFAGEEMAVLENHGYLVADATIQRHVVDLIQQQTPLKIPHPAMMDEVRVRHELANSHKRTLLGRW